MSDNIVGIEPALNRRKTQEEAMDKEARRLVRWKNISKANATIDKCELGEISFIKMIRELEAQIEEHEDPRVIFIFALLLCERGKGPEITTEKVVNLLERATKLGDIDAREELDLYRRLGEGYLWDRASAIENSASDLIPEPGA